MTAAGITPSVVQKISIPSTKVTGTPIRLVQYYIKLTKVTQNDWVLVETAVGTTGNSIVGAVGLIIDSSSNMAQETLAYTDSTDRLVMSAATVGTVHLFIWMNEA